MHMVSKYGPAVLIGLIALLFSACTHFLPAPAHKELVRKAPLDVSYTVEEVLEILARRNLTLNAYKGIGRIGLHDQGQTRSFRLAWAGARPKQEASSESAPENNKSDKLRIEILDISGKPSLSFSNDGTYIYLLSHYDQQFKKKRSSDTDLHHLVSLPILLSDIQAFMSGRVPVRPHHSSTIAAVDGISKDPAEYTPEKASHVIILKKWWGAVVQKMFIDLPEGSVSRIMFFNNNGTLDYMADLRKTKSVRGYVFPRNLVFSDNQGRAAHVSIERLWVNIPVLPAVFSLVKPPENPGN